MGTNDEGKNISEFFCKNKGLEKCPSLYFTIQCEGQKSDL